MQILCAYSSISFHVEHFPGVLSSREACHPVFYVPQKKLLANLGKWASGGLTSTDSYLLFLSLLKSTDLVDFRVPAIRTERTDSIIAQNIEPLARTVIKLNTVSNPAVCFPHYVISPDTKNLDNVRYWIENWRDSYQDFIDGKIRDIEGREEWRKLQFREAALERLIKNPHRPVVSYAGQIADWAALAGAFPSHGTVPSPFTKLPISISDYWKQLIELCAHESKLFSIPRTDLQELLDHCEENIPVGTIYSNALFKIIRHALERQKSFLGLGDLDISRSTYEILNSTDNVEDANLRGAIQSAPAEKPRPDQYPTKFEFLRAQLRWSMAQKHQASTDYPTEDYVPSIEEALKSLSTPSPEAERLYQLGMKYLQEAKKQEAAKYFKQAKDILDKIRRPGKSQE